VTRAVIYVPDGVPGQASPERQESDCRAHASNLGIDVVRILRTGPDVPSGSAAGFDAVVDGAAEGTIDVVVAWSPACLPAQTARQDERVDPEVEVILVHRADPRIRAGYLVALVLFGVTAGVIAGQLASATGADLSQAAVLGVLMGAVPLGSAWWAVRHHPLPLAYRDRLMFLLVFWVIAYLVMAVVYLTRIPDFSLVILIGAALSVMAPVLCLGSFLKARL
jgi:hypothetical protein